MHFIMIIKKSKCNKKTIKIDNKIQKQHNLKIIWFLCTLGSMMG